MSMVVRTNINSMNANRNLGINNSQVAKAIEKLASGYAINRAADDASGLAITEKMQAQITGLDQGTDNALEGIGLVQTAEGAMSEIHDMLNRIVELSTKSANGTIQDEVDREAVQAEVDVLVDEIDRIAQSTNYNGIDLLNGNLSDGGLVIKTNTYTETITTEVEFDSVGTYLVPLVYNSYGLVCGFDLTGLKGSDLIGNSMIITSYWGDTCIINFEDGGVGYVDSSANILLSPNSVNTMYLDPEEEAIDTIASFYVVNNSFYVDANSNSNSLYTPPFIEVWAYYFDYSQIFTGSWLPDSVNSSNGGNAILEHNQSPINILIEISNTTTETTTETTTNITTNTTIICKEGLILHVADQNETYNKIQIIIDSMRASALGVENLDVSSQEGAGAAINIVKDAINYVSTNRCNVGALQNRLEHTINGNNSTSENMISAKSRIKDCDMAKEMTEYTKMNVLTQASQAMLAQSNQSTQQVLSLLE